MLSGRIIGDDRHRSAVGKVSLQAPRIIGAVGGERLRGRDLSEQDDRGPDVAELTRGHLEGDGTVLRVAQSVDLGRAAAARATDPLFFRPPFPPAAGRCALAVVDSSA